MNHTDNIIRLFGNYAESYQEKYMDVSLYKKSLDLFCQSLKNEKNVQVLDIACGPGNITKYLLSQKPILKIHGIDLSSDMINLAKVNNPKATFSCMDCKNILQLKTFFNGIVCGFGLPYLNKEEAISLIRDCSSLLSANGCLYLSTMEGDYALSGYEGSIDNPDEKLFIHYHQEDYLHESLKQNGFGKIQISRLNNVQAASTDLIIVAEKL